MEKFACGDMLFGAIRQRGRRREEQQAQGHEPSAEMRRPEQLRSDPKRRREVIKDHFALETFTLPLEAARLKVRDSLNRAQANGNLDTVEGWRQLADGTIEFTMRRWPASD